MSVHSFYIISESGSLQFYYDHSNPIVESEKSYNYPLPFQLKIVDNRVVIDFGSSEDVKVGRVVVSVNGTPAKGVCLEDGREILKVLDDESNYPLSIRFGKPRLRPNDRIHLTSMFQTLHRMARMLSPVPNTNYPFISESTEKHGPAVWNSGIQTLETSTYRVHCFESYTGVLFLLITDIKLPLASRESLKRVYEAYTDYVLKNPFYSQNQPFNFDFFTNQVKTICEQVERGIYGPT